jgi:hypothetical protein
MGTKRGKKQPKISPLKSQHVVLADDGALAKQDSKQPRAHSFFTKSRRHTKAKGRPAKAGSNAGRRVKNGKEEAPSSNAPSSLSIVRLERDIELHQAKAKAKRMKATRTSFKQEAAQEQLMCPYRTAI